MGGAVRVRSAVGAGSTFEVLLPAVPAGPLAEAAGAPLPRGSGRVLVVDDEAPLTRVCQRMLAQLGYEADVETDPVRALERVRMDPGAFRLVISDGTMPGMTGVELTERLRALRPDLPVLVATGFADAGTAERARAAGARAFVAKPFGLHDLARAVEEALRAAPATKD
jgi:CheY-like chemotaxis protein